MKKFAKLFAFLLLLPALASAQYGGLWNTPERYNAAAVAITGGTISGVGGDTMSSDAAARSSLLHGSNAYPQATVNTTGGDAKVCAGIGRRLFTIVDYSLIDAIDTVTVTVNGSASVKTAGGTDWTAATSNAATATSLATAISTISGVSAVASGSSVYLTPAAATCTLAIATSMDAGEGTATSGTDGTVTVTGATPQDATYWTSSSNATLTNETNLGALTTGLTLNTVAAGVGTPSAYGGTSCTNQFPRSLNASGAATCASVANDDLAGSIAASKLVGTDIATVGTVTAGTWNAGVLGPAYGGAGVANNAAATLTRSGSHALTITTTGTTGVTLPTTGTLVNTLGNVATATALAADPADCGANTFANAINASGTLTCAAVPVAATTGFGTVATQNYTEAGSWTPSVQGTTTTYTKQAGTYTKIGKLACITADLHINSMGDGQQEIDGPPAALSVSAMVFPLSVTYWSGLAINQVWVGAYVSSTAKITLTGTAAAAAAVTNAVAVIGNGTKLIISGCYPTAS